MQGIYKPSHPKHNLVVKQSLTVSQILSKMNYPGRLGTNLVTEQEQGV